MLEPNTRQLLLDCLRPPEGFSLDQAVGTTYSMDLYALLSVPVAFVFRDAMTEEGQADPLATLEGLRRYAAHVHLFCQSGEIHVPRGQQRLFAYLENSVNPVMPAGDSGVFHPKCWLLRFTGPDDAVAYRFICMSRNLTFDRSWDTVLALDGVLEKREVRDPDPQPLIDLLEALPELAQFKVRQEARDAIALMAAELPSVRFECPPGVEGIRFWPMGIDGAAVPDFAPKYRPLLVASPFVSESWLDQCVAGRQRAYLVSREDQLLGLTENTLGRFDEHYTFLQNATPEEDVEAQAEEESLLDGLHAKLFVMNDGWRARVWTGSANATYAAFNHNIEMLVELEGRRKDLGIDALLDDKGSGFRDLLDHWQAPTVKPDTTDPIAERLEALLTVVRRMYAHADLAVYVSDPDEEGQYPLRIEGNWPEPTANVTGTLRPLGLEPERAVDIGSETVSFGAVTLEAMSAFVAIELQASESGQSQRTRFVLRLPLEGAPVDRESRLLCSMLQNRSQLMRLLMILLSDDGIEAMVNAGIGADSWTGGDWLSGGEDTPLLESLLKALDRSPERLDQIKRLLDEMSEGGNLDELLPDGFEDVWSAVWANRAKASNNG